MVARHGRNAGSRRRIVIASVAAGAVALAGAAAFVTPAGAVPDQDPDDTNTPVVVLPDGGQEGGSPELNVLPSEPQAAVSETQQGDENPDAVEVTVPTRGTPTQADGGTPEEPLVTLPPDSQEASPAPD